WTDPLIGRLSRSFRARPCGRGFLGFRFASPQAILKRSFAAEGAGTNALEKRTRDRSSSKVKAKNRNGFNRRLHGYNRLRLSTPEVLPRKDSYVHPPITLSKSVKSAESAVSIPVRAKRGTGQISEVNSEFCLLFSSFCFGGADRVRGRVRVRVRG